MFLSVSLHWLGIVKWLKLNALSMLVAFKYLNKDNDFAADVHVFAANFITISPLKKNRMDILQIHFAPGSVSLPSRVTK